MNQPSSTVGAARHHVYILTCADGTLYTGYTTNPLRRLGQHNSGRASKYTRGRLPARLSYLESSATKGSALRRELVIKRMSRRAKLLLCAQYNPSQGLSLR